LAEAIALSCTPQRLVSLQNFFVAMRERPRHPRRWWWSMLFEQSGDGELTEYGLREREQHRQDIAARAAREARARA
jgi:hypothetical protein